MSIRITRGDVFRVNLSNGTIRYFQFIGKDKSELNGDVIAIFRTRYIVDNDNKERIIRDDIECFMHASVLSGVKLNLWNRAFSSPVIITDKVMFRTSLDIGLYPRQLVVSNRWVVWAMNEERKYVGTLPKKYYNTDIGGVYAPIHVIYRLETGERPDKYYPLY